MGETSIEDVRLEWEKRFGKIDADLRENRQNIQLLIKRTDEQSTMLKDIQELNTSVSVLANNMKALVEEQKAQNIRIQNIESKPARRWDTIIDKVVTCIVGALVAFLLIRLGLPT